MDKLLVICVFLVFLALLLLLLAQMDCCAQEVDIEFAWFVSMGHQLPDFLILQS
jgi:hypothetical protein